MLPASSDSLAPGVSFGSYVVRELIGRGGMASVYRAEHLLLNKPVALKVMERSLLATAGSRQRFVLEGRAAAAIKHPNIVDITDVGVHDDVPFLVMELLTGQDLHVHLQRQGPLDEASTIRLALPIIAALHAAHGRGVVHRDVKPSNIFLSEGADDQIVPKVLDFGISKVTTEGVPTELSLTPQQHVMGTPRYLPPEALRGTRELGPAADQFSLGVVLYECVTGTTPFAGDTLIALLNALSAGAFVPPRALAPHLSVSFDRVIMRALALQPEERFPTIRDMGRALLELGAERTQMVWGHSFKAPGEEPFPSKARAAAPAETRAAASAETRTIANPTARNRRIALGAGFIAIGALASALTTAFVRGSVPTAKDPAAALSTVTAAATPAAAVVVPVRPVASEPESGSDAPQPPRASESAPADRTPERARPSRPPQKRSTGHSARRAEGSGASTNERASARADADGVISPPAVPSAGAVSPRVEEPPAAAPVTPAPNASPAERVPAPRRQGANRSPLLD